MGGRITPSVSAPVSKSKGGGGGSLPGLGAGAGGNIDLLEILKVLAKSNVPQSGQGSGAMSEISELLQALIKESQDEKKYQRRREESKEDYSDRLEAELANAEKQILLQQRMEGVGAEDALARDKASSQQAADIAVDANKKGAEFAEKIRKQGFAADRELGMSDKQAESLLILYAQRMSRMIDTRTAFVREARVNLENAFNEGQFRGPSGMKQYQDLLRQLNFMGAYTATLDTSHYQSKLLESYRKATRGIGEGDSDALATLASELQGLETSATQGLQLPLGRTEFRDLKLEGDPEVADHMPDHTQFTPKETFEAKWSLGYPEEGFMGLAPDDPRHAFNSGPADHTGLILSMFEQTKIAHVQNEESKRKVLTEDVKTLLRQQVDISEIKKIAVKGYEVGEELGPTSLLSGITKWANELSNDPWGPHTASQEAIRHRMAGWVLASLANVESPDDPFVKTAFAVMDGTMELDTAAGGAMAAWTSGLLGSLEAIAGNMTSVDGKDVRLGQLYKQLRTQQDGPSRPWLTGRRSKKGNLRAPLTDAALATLNRVLGASSPMKFYMGESGEADDTSGAYSTFTRLVLGLEGTFANLSNAAFDTPYIRQASRNFRTVGLRQDVVRFQGDAFEPVGESDLVASLQGDPRYEDAGPEGLIPGLGPRIPTPIEAWISQAENFPYGLHHSVDLVRALYANKLPELTGDQQTVTKFLEGSRFFRGRRDQKGPANRPGSKATAPPFGASAPQGPPPPAKGAGAGAGTGQPGVPQLGLPQAGAPQPSPITQPAGPPPGLAPPVAGPGGQPRVQTEGVLP